MLKKQRNTENCNFFIRISSCCSGFDFSEFHYNNTFISVIQDSRMKFVINPMDVLIFFNKQIWYKSQIMLKKQRNSGNCNFSYAYPAVPVGLIFLNFIILTHLYQLYRMHVINESTVPDLGQKTPHRKVYLNKKIVPENANVKLIYGALFIFFLGNPFLAIWLVFFFPRIDSGNHFFFDNF